MGKNEDLVLLSFANLASHDTVLDDGQQGTSPNRHR